MMAPLTEIVAAVVAHSSAVAFSHFGVVLEPPPRAERPQPVAERVVARTPAVRPPVDKSNDGPEARQPQKQPQAKA